MFSVVLFVLMIITEALGVFYNDVMPKTKLISVSFYVTLTFWSSKTLDETSYSCQTHGFFLQKYTNISETSENGGIASILFFCSHDTGSHNKDFFVRILFLSRESLASYYHPIIVLSPVTSRWKWTNV